MYIKRNKFDEGTGDLVGFAVMEAATETKLTNITKSKIDGYSFASFYTKLQDFDENNRNGRNYLHEAMVPALTKNANLTELMYRKKWYGEFSHPDGQTHKMLPERIATIQYDKVSHRINSIDVTNQSVCGNIDTTIFSQGPEFFKAILQGDHPSFSLRGFAKMEQRNGIMVVRAAKPITYDAVILPSHKGAYIDLSRPTTYNNAVTESFVDGFSTNEQVTEGVCIEVVESTMDWLMNESCILRMISEEMEVATESMSLMPGGKHVYMKKDTGLSYIVNLEEKVTMDYRSIMKGL